MSDHHEVPKLVGDCHMVLSKPSLNNNNKIIIIPEQFIERLVVWSIPHQEGFDIFNDDGQRVQ